MQPKEYEKYRWFFTSTNKLVIGGKSAEQNEELLKKMKKTNKDYVIMHTSDPGSPFSIILADKKSITVEDLEETTIFTGCFSRAWRSAKKKTSVDVFSLSQMFKESSMKTGTWGVTPKVIRKTVKLELVLAKQKQKLRAVPEKSVKPEKILLKIKPGKVDKTKMIDKINSHFEKPFKQEELLSALPPGGVSIRK